eukprot:COSAG02_NODE_3936_length_6021_cov_284.388551_3_plen_197_part_00
MSMQDCLGGGRPIRRSEVAFPACALLITTHINPLQLHGHAGGWPSPRAAGARLVARRWLGRPALVGSFGMLGRVASAVVLLAVQSAQHAGAQSDYGTACSLSACSCAGYCLSDEKGKVIDTPPDSEGYAYKFSLCSVIPEDQLPTGCRDYSSDATVVRYKVRLSFLSLPPPPPAAPTPTAPLSASLRSASGAARIT